MFASRLWLCCGLCLCVLLLSSCASAPPKRLDNICHIFDDKRRWYKHALKAEKKWGSPIAISMAIMHQESRFIRDAKPPRKKLLGFIPAGRLSDAYGYPQAKKATWAWYIKSSGNRGADRDNFADAIDFIGWYNAQTRKRNKVSATNAYGLYLAYHEGHGGFNRKTYNKKQWLLKVADKVAWRAKKYNQQLAQCKK